MFIGGIISFILLLWMCARIWKQSVLLAIVSFFFWPALIFSVIKFWGDEDSDIKLPFVFFMLASIYAWYDMAQTAKALKEQQDTLLWALQTFA